MNADTKTSEQLKDIADKLGVLLAEAAGQKMNFSLIVFQAEVGSRMNYISNCKREDVVHAMTSLLNGWREGMPDIPANEYKG